MSGASRAIDRAPDMEIDHPGGHVTAVARVDSQVVDRYSDREMVDTLKQTVCKGATDAQFKMFVEVCRATGLNPFLKEIWYVPSVGVIAGRDGYLRVANENPMFDGMKTVVERDEKNVPVKATCSVWRKDRSHPVECEAYFSEYRKGGTWNQYPSAMISKVAEVLALKRSFSINGVVTEEEIGDQPAEPRQSPKEAAAELGQKKVAALAAGRPRAEVENILEGQIEDPMHVSTADYVPPSELEQQLQASINQTQKEPPDKFKALAAFGDLKAAIIKDTGDDKLYYQALGNLGYLKSNEIPKEKTRSVYSAVSKALIQWRVDRDGIDEAIYGKQA